MKKTNIKIVLILVFFILISCGTGPWFIKGKIYEVYKQPVYSGIENKNKIQINGYYIQTGTLHKNNSFRSALIFYANGYLKEFSIPDINFEIELKKQILEANNYKSTALDWYKVVGDSLIIEYFGDTDMEMISSVYYMKGEINSDLSLELKFDDLPDRIYKYKFVKNDSLSKIKNNALYLNKNWYNRNLNDSRK